MNVPRIVVFSLVAGLGTPAWSQTPYLVKDIDPAAASGSVGTPRALTVAGPTLFTLADLETGRGLVRIDGSGAPALVRAIPDNVELARGMTAVGNSVFFNAQGALWRSDGTAAGTTVLKQLKTPGGLPAGAGRELVNANGVVYFTVFGTGANELWKSDGTTAGTVRVATVLARDLVAAGNRLFFTTLGDTLWTSDGTEAGTVPLGTVVVKDVLSKIVPDGNGILFVGSGTGGVGGDLWRSDGTPGGTVRVKAFAPATVHSLTRLGNVFLFAIAGPTTGIWRTDGTEAGTTLVKDAVAVRSMHEANGTVFLHGHTPAAGYELWTSDGTTAGTVVVDVCSGTCSTLTPSNTYFATTSTGVVFSRRPYADLWRTDGTVAGTVLIGDVTGCMDFGDLSGLTSFAGSAYFAVCDGSPEAAWRTDGTPAGTRKLFAGLDGASSSPTFVGDAGPRAIFAAARPDVGREIWSTAGTDPSTQLLADLTAGFSGTDWKPIASLGPLFTFTPVTSPNGGPLWSTDGSPAGTRQIASFPTDYTRGAAVRDGLAVFGMGELGTIGTKPFRTDGTPEGTFAVAPPAGASGFFGLARGNEAIAAHGPGFALAMGEQTQVWFTVDGSAPTDRFTPTALCSRLTSVDEKLFLACRTSGDDDDLWISDGTYSGTHLLVDLPGGALPGWVALEGKLFFRVAGSGGPELWSSDGTAAGTAPLSSIATVPSSVQGLTASNGVLYFAGFTFESGIELWRTDGTAAGTFLLRDFDPGPASGIALDFESTASIAPVAGGVVFTATSPTRGAELWWSDGTPAGTIALPEIAPGPASASPTTLRHVGDRIYFAADDGPRGREPWAVVFGAPSLSVADVSVAEGNSGTTAASFAIRLDQPFATPVTVSYTTVADTAQANVDFVPVSGTVTFAAGAQAAAVDVQVKGDLQDESDEAFALEITPVSSGIAIADGRGAGVIADDDLPSIAATGDASVVEGNGSPATAAFPITLTTGDGQPTPHGVVARGTIVLGTTAWEDFGYFGLPVGIVSFPAGSASGTTLPMHIPVADDALDEPNENFQVRLEGQNDALVGGDAPTGVIIDDDGVAAAGPFEIAHGTTIHADLVPPAGSPTDVDFYVMQQGGYTSYELVADGVSGDAAPLVIDRLAGDGSIIQSAAPTGTGSALSMRWLGVPIPGQHLRVTGACASACGTDDVYRLRLYETTLALSRVNNSGSQTTVLVLQNTTDSPVGALVVRWFPDGGVDEFEGVTVVTIPARATEVVATVTPVLATFTGSITVAHDAPYGALVGKAVTFDPASGFAFDTPLTNRRQ